MRPLLLLALLLATAAQAQQRQPANVSTLPQSSPQEFDLLDNQGRWMPFGTGSGGVFSPATTPNTVNPVSFGAKCDGTTNDHDAIQNAINAVQAMPGGGTVVIPPSTSGCLSNSTLNITASNVTLTGAQMGGSVLLFANGSADSLVVGNGRGTPAVNYINIHDLQINHAAGKTGGYGLRFVSASQATVRNVWLNGVYNGLSADQINNLIVYNIVINGIANDPGHGIDFVTANDGSVKSDVFSLTDVVVNMHSTTAGLASECIRIDGASNTIRGKSVGLLNCGYGLRITNSNSAYVANGYPTFGFFQDLEVEAWITAVRIEAGAEWMFSNSIVNNYHDTNPADATVEIFGDASASITRSIMFSGSQIKTGPGTCLRVNGVHGFYMTGTNVSQCGVFAGPNATPPAAAVPAIDIGSGVTGFIAVGDAIGYEFGQGPSGAVNYAVQIESGASNVILGANDYTLFGGASIVNNLSLPTALSIASGGFGVTATGGGFGQNFQPGSPGASNPGATNQAFLKNSATTAGTSAQINASTGTANAYTLMGNNDGTTPTGVVASGAGDTGGLLVQAGAGHAVVQASASDVVLSPAAANNVQLTNTGSFDGNKANCGNITGSTGCVVIKDNTGVVRKAPLF